VRRLVGLAAAALLLASAARAQTPAPSPQASPKPRRARTPGPAKAAPINFSGVWVLDPKASRGVSKNMEDAVLQVRQNGNRIWIEPIEQKGRRLLSEEIVVDGQLYEKAVGAGQKGTVEAAWGKDGTSLWIEAVVGTDENPRAASQRMIWRLRDDGKTWTRQTRTLQADGAKDTFLVFRKRGKTP
jgi:hypothetical protein